MKTDFNHPVIAFDCNNTYIQSEGINQDFGDYDSPVNMLEEHHQEMSWLKDFVYRNIRETSDECQCEEDSKCKVIIRQYGKGRFVFFMKVS